MTPLAWGAVGVAVVVGWVLALLWNEWRHETPAPKPHGSNALDE
jgi:hypothetical protein